MALGAGKYDGLCTMVREQAKAEGAIVVIINGEHGQGFSVQVSDLSVMPTVADALEQVAATIRKDLKVAMQ